MISTFHEKPLTSGQGLCDINIQCNSEKQIKNMSSGMGHGGMKPIIPVFHFTKNGHNSSMQDFYFLFFPE